VRAARLTAWDHQVVTTPAELDGAVVLAAAVIGPNAPIRTHHIVKGELANPRIQRLAIARYDDQEGYYLFYCDSTWAVVTDTYHDTFDGAVEQARFEFGPLSFSDSTDQS
jgi:hypothetical protein